MPECFAVLVRPMSSATRFAISDAILRLKCAAHLGILANTQICCDAQQTEVVVHDTLSSLYVSRSTLLLVLVINAILNTPLSPFGCLAFVAKKVDIDHVHQTSTRFPTRVGTAVSRVAVAQCQYADYF